MSPLRRDRASRRSSSRRETTFDPEVEWLQAWLADVDDEFDLPRALASFPVYRTYVDPDAGEVDGLDRQAISAGSSPLPPRSDPPARGARTRRLRGPLPADARRPSWRRAIEDTAFYRYNRLLCLNEVGGDPACASIWRSTTSTRGNLERARRFPLQLLATQTHDTKRSGDVRARICGAHVARRRVARARPRLAAAERSAAPERRARPGRGVPDLPDARRRLAARRPGGCSSTSEGAARGEDEHELDRAKRGVGARRGRLRARPSTTTAPFLDPSSRSQRASRSSAAGSPSPRRSSSSPARACPTSTRATSS